MPALGERSQAIVNKQLVGDADVLIGVFKARLGSSTGVSQSGTIEEIERCNKAGKPVMLYFSTGPVPREHDVEQLQSVKNYQRQIAGRSIYGEFYDLEDLRRKVNRHLASTMAKIGTETSSSAIPTDKNDLARVSYPITSWSAEWRCEDSPVSAVIENVSDRRKIKDYVSPCLFRSACLTHTSASIMGEVRKGEQANRRFFRRSNSDGGSVAIIFQGDKVPIFALDLGVDQLRLTGRTLCAGDYEGTLADNVIVDAVVEGELLHAERTVADLFANPHQS